MGYWGVRSYENDEADEALDRGFESVHAETYDELMDDRNPMTREQVQAQLANPATLKAAIGYLCEQEPDHDEWDEEVRLGFVGVVVRHAELGVSIPAEWRTRAIEWLRDESIDWDETTLRKLRLRKEIEILESSADRAGG